ncbi:MAG: hypothetical protein RL385_4064, partial [Pseudomonadota bacterium]
PTAGGVPKRLGPKFGDFLRILLCQSAPSCRCEQLCGTKLTGAVRMAIAMAAAGRNHGPALKFRSLRVGCEDLRRQEAAHQGTHIGGVGPCYVVLAAWDHHKLCVRQQLFEGLADG